MKNSLLLRALSIVFLGCFSDDDFGRYVSLTIEDALVLENQGNYVVGDTIFFELNFSRYLDEEGQPNKLDIYESTASESFSYDFGISKFSELAGGFQRVSINEAFIIVEKGQVQGGNYVSAILNNGQDQYESRIGILLVEEGRFRFDFDFFAIRSDGYEQDKVQIDIQHRFVETIPELEFVVTEN